MHFKGMEAIGLSVPEAAGFFGAQDFRDTGFILDDGRIVGEGILHPCQGFPDIGARGVVRKPVVDPAALFVAFDEAGLTMADEQVETQHGITLFDPIETWKECTYVNCTARCLSTPIYENGKRVYQSPSLNDIKKFCKAQVNTLWDEVKRFENPHRYYVDLSQKLWDTRSALLKKLSK